MHSHAIHPHERCTPEDPYDLRSVWRAITGGPGGGHRHGHHRGRGYGPWPRGGLGGFGPRGPFGRHKARRGDIRTAALLLLAEEPRNGYQIMQELEQRSEGVWRPSPGSVYPALQQLEDEGLIRSGQADGRKVYEITDAGRGHVEDRGAEARPPWEEMTRDYSDAAFELGGIFRELSFAFMQVMRTGSEAQMAEARKVLGGARRDLYRILADGDLGDSGGYGADEEDAGGDEAA